MILAWNRLALSNRSFLYYVYIIFNFFVFAIFLTCGTAIKRFRQDSFDEWKQRKMISGKFFENFFIKWGDFKYCEIAAIKYRTSSVHSTYILFTSIGLMVALQAILDRELSSFLTSYFLILHQHVRYLWGYSSRSWGHNTPYHDCLFFFEVLFCSSYPNDFLVSNLNFLFLCRLLGFYRN